MEQVMKHYGNAILAIIVLLALGAIMIMLLSTSDDGFVMGAFKDAMTSFFGNMSSLGGMSAG